MNNVGTMEEVSAVSPSYSVAHSIVLQDRFIQVKEMERNDSQPIDDSRFTSALTTLVDQEVASTSNTRLLREICLAQR